MIDVVEETLDIQVNHRVKLPASLPRLPHCVQRRFPRPVLIRPEVGRHPLLRNQAAALLFCYTTRLLTYGRINSRKNPDGTADLSPVPVSTSPPFARSDPIQLESPTAFPRHLPSVSSPSAPAAESSCPTTSDSRSYTGSFSGSSRNP